MTRTDTHCRALVFDLDDTLYAEREFVLSGFSAVAKWLRDNKRVAGFESLAAEALHRGLRGRIFDDALTQLGIDPQPSLISTLVQVYRDHIPVLTLYDDARHALDRFRPAAKLGIITDGFLQTQRNKVRALGLWPLVDAIVFSDQWGRDKWKPHPLPYESLASQLACCGVQCTYIADNPAKDFIGARLLGWHTIRIRRPQGEYAGVEPAKGYEADADISSLEELRSVLSL